VELLQYLDSKDPQGYSLAPKCDQGSVPRFDNEGAGLVKLPGSAGPFARFVPTSQTRDRCRSIFVSETRPHPAKANHSMKTHSNEIRRRSSRRIHAIPTAVSAIALAALIPGSAALADGQIRFKVANSRTKAPLPGAVIKIEPQASEIDELQFSTASNGTVATGDLASGARSFEVSAIVNGVVYKKFKGRITVADDQVVDVEVLLDEQGFDVRETVSSLLRINVDDTSQSTFRDRKFFEYYPLAAGNRQNLGKSLRSIPGFVPGAVNQLHARGEQSNVIASLDGFLLPPTLVGQAGGWLAPAAIETVSARTGGYGAHLGGASGSILDIGLRPTISGNPKNPLEPISEWSLSTGDFGTREGTFTIARQRGDQPGTRGDVGYFLTFAKRDTSNVLESPQPGRQNANNGGGADTILGKIDFQLGNGTEITTLVHHGFSRTGVANRTGLGGAFGVNDGYGFGGLSDAGSFTDLNGVVHNQEVDGNRVFQRDLSRIFVTQIRKRFSTRLSGVVSVGTVRSGQEVTNQSPRADLANLPLDSNNEINPSVVNRYDSQQFQADFTLGEPSSAHTLRYGLLVRDTVGGDTARLFPNSLAALGAVLNTSPFLTSLFDLSRFGANNTVPVLFIERAQQYNAFYVSDAWKLNTSLRLDLGVRYETYNQKERYYNGVPVQPSIVRNSRSESAASPRVNLLWQMPRKAKLLGLRLGGTQPTVLRAGYNQVLSPTLSAGNVGNFGTGSLAANLDPLAAQRTKQTDFSIERQLRRQNVKLGWYSKTAEGAYGYQQLIDGPQTVGYSAGSLGRSEADGFEFSWEYNPRDFAPRVGELAAMPAGFNGFVVYNSGKVRIDGVNVPGFDQQSTLVGGLGYTLADGDSVVLSAYRGSGLAASAFSPTAGRQAITEVNLRILAAPNRSGGRTVEFAVENLADSRGVVNFASPVAGTRFQQGRRFVLTVSGKY
jgi:outer membrane receptor protein involved in Fe transport